MHDFLSGQINKFCHTYTQNFSYDFCEDALTALLSNKQSYSSRRQVKNDFAIFRNWRLVKVTRKLSISFLARFLFVNFMHSVRLNKRYLMVFYSIVRGFLFLLIKNSRFYLVLDERNKFFGIISFYTDGELLHWAQGISSDKRSLSSLSIYLSVALATQMRIKTISLGPTNDETKRRRGFQKSAIASLRSMNRFVVIPYGVRINEEMSGLDDMFEFVVEG